MGSRGRYIRIKYIMQLKTATPMFAFFCNLPDDVKDSYRRFIENQIREHLTSPEYQFRYFLERSRELGA
jgi:Predicted GTPases